MQRVVLKHHRASKKQLARALAGCLVVLSHLLRVRRLISMGLAVNIHCQRVHPVIALQPFLRRHVALTGVADGLLQLGEA
ncbi:hypothetical protein BFL39_10260 [Pseudomonas azotoformans]|nr:hypothetical protein BFL39_10260 [Pseudomonas azotoformans]